MRLLVAFLPSVVLLSSCAPAGAWLRSPSPFDVVIAGGRVIDRIELLTAVWGYPRAEAVESRCVDMHLVKLRRKLGEAFGEALAIGAWRIGTRRPKRD